MYNAPLVRYPVGRFAWALWASAGLGLTVLLITSSLLFRGQISPVWVLLSWGLVAASWLHSGRHQQAPVWLVWDGQGWQCWQDDEGQEALSVQSLSVQADFQQVLLLRLSFHGAAGLDSAAQWLWLYKGFAPAQWHGLRCAVYSRWSGRRTT